MSMIFTMFISRSYTLGAALICFLILLFVTPVLGQRARYKPQVHEIGLQAGQATYPGSFAQYLDGNLPINALAVNGLRYKYHLTMADGFRFGAFWQQHAYTAEPGAFSELFSEASYRGALIQLGYERKYHRGPHQFFGGADLVLSQGQLTNDVEPIGSGIVTQTVDQRRWGLAILGGYSLFMSKHISVTLEAQAHYLRVNPHNPLNLNPIEFAPYVLPGEEWGLSLSAYISFHTQNMRKRCSCPKH